MAEQFTYQEYVSDETFLAQYNAYQERYASTIRESDRVIIEKVNAFVSQCDREMPRVLDIGCSTGNLLLHMHRMVPSAEYVGGDLALSSLEECKTNPDLADVTFSEMDILNLPEASFDVIVVNAVVYMFDDEQYEKALASLCNGLREGGIIVMYDFAHPFAHQNLTIYETTVFRPEGLRLCFRPMPRVQSAAEQAGFSGVDFYPFEIPIDLEKPGYDEEVVTYTQTKQDGERLMFRGALFQPWCHIVMKK